ncbi:hypothetical protein JOC54_002312 [Alkalihalobacillus xiaoxiensis]|uniref:Uncharacterized protein n=1 Tax=Shouchella xiaoxiensis TaxID=766895 RepID=A0ABS2SU49_9BACI|nr:hypothetical protein [Shouchella xiaoxiensis]MBM7839042.1 hypothetical protein [Shouchella xiaoxiensis]
MAKIYVVLEGLITEFEAKLNRELTKEELDLLEYIASKLEASTE